MPSLLELQAAFVQGVFARPGALLLEALAGDERLDAAQRLAIYRNNIFANYRDALAEVYPVVRRLVGDDCFGQAAAAFVRHQPSASGDLHDFGESFGAFLASYQPTQGLAYLPDVAQLEWAVHRVFHAAEAAPFPLESLATLAPERFSGLCLALSPAARLLASGYPIVRIWEVNQSGFEADQAVDLEQGGERALVARHHGAVEVRRLSSGEFAMLAALASGRRLAPAFEEAAGAEPGFDLQAFLCRHLLAGVLCGFHVD